ncbi:MAG: hypothetical protein RLZ62_1781 [Bacteroidota bacterium]|jgi:hypothetical protein
MMIKQVISLFLMFSVLTESLSTYYQDSWFAEISNTEVNFSESDELKESDASIYLQSKDHHLSPCTSALAERKRICFHFSETAPEDASRSVASPPPEFY